MPILIAAAAFVVALFAVSRLIVVYDRRFILFEYGRRLQTCPGCGRACLGVRRRVALDEPWGELRSECCGEELDT
jgi:hypothetical protein